MKKQILRALKHLDRDELLRVLNQLSADEAEHRSEVMRQAFDNNRVLRGVVAQMPGNHQMIVLRTLLRQLVTILYQLQCYDENPNGQNESWSRRAQAARDYKVRDARWLLVEQQCLPRVPVAA